MILLLLLPLVCSGLQGARGPIGRRRAGVARIVGPDVHPGCDPCSVPYRILMPNQVWVEQASAGGTKGPFSSPWDEGLSSARMTVEAILAAIKNETSNVLSKRPPAQIEDTNVLLYDICLLINLAVSISYFVIHRMSLNYIGAAFNEGCLLSLLWIASGLYTGAFLHSAVDGHNTSLSGHDGSSSGGPPAAALLALHTYIVTINLRLVFALVVAAVEHRLVGAALGEQLMPLEIGFGLVLMSVWRTLHSTYSPRM